ncbi:MAG: MBL fold metallo-hydrolase, partial [Bacteroidia bacterium]
RSSLLIQTGRFDFVIDAGPDFRQQMLRENVQNLDAILLTHEHKDHIAGIDDVRAFNYKSRKAIDLFCEESVQMAVRREYPYVFAEKRYPGAPMLNLHTVDESPFMLGGLEVVPVRASHFWLPVFGFRISDLAYITDANYISPENIEKLKGVKYFILNALRKEKHISHYNLDEAIEVIREVNPLHGFITHISHQMGFHNDVSESLPPGISLAYDGLGFECE